MAHQVFHSIESEGVETIFNDLDPDLPLVDQLDIAQRHAEPDTKESFACEADEK